MSTRLSVTDTIGNLGMKKIVTGICVTIILIFTYVMLRSLIVDVPAIQYIVKQEFITGKLTVFDKPGWEMQNFADLQNYDRSSQLWFSNQQTQGGTIDGSLPLRFSDGGTAKISGSLRYDLPAGADLLALHQRYKTAAAIERDLIIPTVQKATQFSGPMMSSKESAASKRNDLLTIIEDQIVNGVYKTTTKKVEVDDITTGGGAKKLVDMLVPVADPSAPNGIARAESSPIQKAGITIHAVAINDIRYDDKVEAAIQRQYELEMEIQTALTRTRTAHQEAITAEATGKANTAKAEWSEREVAVREQVRAERDASVAAIEANKRLKVAEYDKRTANEEKSAKILRAEGEAVAMERVADARKKQMLADGALEQKLRTYEAVNAAYANSISQITLPQIVFGSGNGTTSAGVDGVASLIQMLNAKTAKELSLDMSVVNNK